MARRERKKEPESGLFDEEEQAIAAAEALLEADGLSTAQAAEALADLLKQYRKLFKQSRRLIRMSDRNEAKFIEQNQLLESQAEELREAREVAEEATKAKSSFLATMSHEIRTPMNGLMSMAELLTQTELTDEQHSMATIIRESGTSLLVIINDILDFSKIEAGKMDLEILDVSVVELAESVAQLLAPQAFEKGITISAYVDPALPETVRGDPVRLRQILLNLAGNAVKFTETGGVRIEVAAAGSDLALRVTDSGIGMTEEQRQRLFQPFQQADTSTARKFGGTGLGLTICRRLVEMMDGSIGVDSTPGEGSVFWFKVPLQPVEQGASSLDLDLGAAKVLLAGPDADNQVIMAGYLAYQGIAADTAATGIDAVTACAAAAAADAPYDVVFIDYVLKETDGLRRGREILAGGGAKNIVLVLPYGAQALQGEADAAGFVGSLSKPIQRDLVWRMTGAALGLVERDEAVVGANRTAKTYVPPDPATARTAGALILVAEDNATNQVVIRKILDKLGFAAEIADDGAQAFEMLQAAPYGLLLTDCHMPEVDGYELTALVRDWEARDGRPRLPVVALTADALAGTEKMCLDAGMDGYLSKPVELARLEAIISEWLPAATELREAGAHAAAGAAEADPGAEAGPEATDDSGLAILDLEMILFLFDEINDEAREMLGDFLDANRDRISQFHSALDGDDLTEAREIAHGIKGAANSVGAKSFGQLAADIEDRLKQDDPDGARGLAPELAPAFATVERVIQML